MTGGTDRALPAACLFIVLLAAIAAVRWTAAHPYPIWWDEANYFNQVVDDRRAFLEGGPVAMAKSLLFADNERPPAYRAIVAPLAAATLPNLTLLRTIALGVTMLSAIFLWLAGRTLADSESSLLAAAMVFSMPEVLSSGAWFGSEYPLFLAIALLLYAVVRRAPVLIAVAVALGLLTKTSFLLIGGVAVLVALVATLVVGRDRREAEKVLIASVCGALIAAGWWWVNLRSALDFAELGRTFERTAQTNPLSLGALVDKTHLLVRGLSGGFVATAALLAFNALRVRQPISPEARRALLVAAAVIVPILLISMLSPVFIPRHFAPALLALAIPMTILLQRASRSIRLLVAAIVIVQIGWMAAAPLSFLPRVEQTNWAQLRHLIPKPSPRIAFLGGWPSLSPPEIRYAWTRDGNDASIDWLWRSEQRRIDWLAVMRSALASDVILVVPPSSGMHPSLSDHERRDNTHNSELIQRLQRSGEFANPIAFRIGTRQSVDALVYLRVSGTKRK